MERAAIDWLGRPAPAEVHSVLRRRAWSLRHLPPPDVPVVPSSASARLAIVALGDAAGDEALERAEVWLRERGGRTLVVLLAEASAAQRRWAARLTPLCWPWPISSEMLADLLEHVRPDTALAEAPLPPREVVVTLGESVVVDGCHVPLGVAERNFLFHLASAPDVRVSKMDDVAGERGRAIEARECRRRLGRKLGAELAELLVPAMRGEPYRFREPAEVAAMSGGGGERGQRPTRLRVVGRASVRTGWSPGAAVLLA